MTPFTDNAVAAAFDAYPPEPRRKLMALRELIFKTGAATDGVGELKEALKWGEPAYVTSRTRSGSTIRIAWKRSVPTQYAMYFNCQTDLVETFRTLLPSDFRFESNRAIVFDIDAPVPTAPLVFCIAAALTYHLRKTASGQLVLSPKEEADLVDAMAEADRGETISADQLPARLRRLKER